MQKLTIIEGTRKIVQVPKVYKNTVFFDAENDEVHAANGFYTIIYPTLIDNQRIDVDLNNGTINEELGTFIYGIIEVEEKTAQQLYDELIEQGKRVFDEFSIELSKAAIPYNILNNHPEQLKELTRQLLEVKEEIKKGLKYYLDNDMTEQLKSFNFNDERAEQLRNAINSFK